MKFLKQAVKKYLRKSKFFKKIIKKLNEVARQEDPSIQKSKAKSTSNASSGRGKDVIYPLIKEYKYNKRIYNYLLENQDGYSIKKWVIEQMYYSTIGRFPNLDHPQSLNEKMQWMRLHYHDPLMVKCVDKCSFKDYIKEHVGREFHAVHVHIIIGILRFCFPITTHKEMPANAIVTIKFIINNFTAFRLQQLFSNNSWRNIFTIPFKGLIIIIVPWHEPITQQ